MSVSGIQLLSITASVGGILEIESLVFSPPVGDGMLMAVDTFCFCTFGRAGCLITVLFLYVMFQLPSGTLINGRYS